VNPNGIATDAYFEYGTDPNLATFTVTSTQAMGSGSTDQSIAASVSLSAGTTYYFRVVATNAGGTTKGTILSFATLFFFDDFGTDTTGSYTKTDTQGNGYTFTWDSVGKRAQVILGQDKGMAFSDGTPVIDNGVFSLDFLPTAPPYGTHGGFWIRLMQDNTNYYEVSNFDWGSGTPVAPDLAAVKKIVGGSVVDEQLFTTGYAQDTTYTITIAFSPTQVTLGGFGAPVVLNASDTTAIMVDTITVETGQQDAYYDNISLVGGP
jgi:hypothetical protein